MGGRLVGLLVKPRNGYNGLVGSVKDDELMG